MDEIRSLNKVLKEVRKAVSGKDEFLVRVQLAILARGHVLL